MCVPVRMRVCARERGTVHKSVLVPTWRPEAAVWLGTVTLLFFIAYTRLAGLGAAVNSACISHLAVEGLASQRQHHIQFSIGCELHRHAPVLKDDRPTRYH